MQDQTDATTDAEGCVSYVAGGVDASDDADLVICDRWNPRAWIRSDVTTTVDP